VRCESRSLPGANPAEWRKNLLVLHLPGHGRREVTPAALKVSIRLGQFTERRASAIGGRAARPISGEVLAGWPPSTSRIPGARGVEDKEMATCVARRQAEFWSGSHAEDEVYEDE